MLNERIKAVRKHFGLTQTEFGEKIGVKGNTITGYENGIRTPSNAVLVSICDKYDVNPEWLEHGTGEMFVQITREEQVGEFLTGAWKGNDPFKQKIIAGLAALDENDWKNLKAIIEKMAKNMAGEE